MGGVRRRVHALGAAWAIALLLPAPVAAASGSLRAEGSGLRLTLPDGRVLLSPDLVGAKLHMADGSVLRLDAVAAATDARRRPLWLHAVSMRDERGEWSPLCAPHADGSRDALVVPGRERRDGTIAAAGSRYVITCTSGAQGKCLLAGYRPWLRGQRALYNACIRLLRADYGGDGRTHTENGRAVDLYDDAGIQRPARLPRQRFEAGWTAAGAVCVRHLRVAGGTTLDALVRRYPRLRGKVGAVCSESYARAHGALLFNRSSPLEQR